ncbi:MAG: hypothetical protein IJ088_16425 [Clostridia bacterium]|nr:hypothetical protein [Clostridia bacterium]
MLRANGIRNWVRSNTWQETLQIMESGGNVNFVQEKKSLTDVMATMLFAATYLYVNRLGRLMLSLPFPLTHTVRANAPHTALHLAVRHCYLSRVLTDSLYLRTEDQQLESFNMGIQGLHGSDKCISASSGV